MFSSVQIIIDLLFEKKVWKSFSHLSQQSLPSSWGLRTKATRVHCIIRSHQCCERLPASDGSGTHLSIFAWHFIIETFCMREQPILFDIGSSGPQVLDCALYFGIEPGTGRCIAISFLFLWLLASDFWWVFLGNGPSSQSWNFLHACLVGEYLKYGSYRAQQ